MANGNHTGYSLRRRREAAGLTRAQLARLADCSLASLANIEQGAVPKQSQVLQKANDALAALEEAAA